MEREVGSRDSTALRPVPPGKLRHSIGIFGRSAAPPLLKATCALPQLSMASLEVVIPLSSASHMGLPMALRERHASPRQYISEVGGEESAELWV